jgi:hypothetical protein
VRESLQPYGDRATKVRSGPARRRRSEKAAVGGRGISKGCHG